MASERELGIRLTAEDDASDKIEQVAEAVEQLDEDAVVEVEAETSDARSDIERFADELEGLTKDAQEVRVEFKAQQLERQLKKTLRELEELEDPVELEVSSGNLEKTLSDIEELNRLAADVIEVDVQVDPKRTARTAADDVEGLRQKGEGLQSAIPAIRGFGDELGGTAQGAGIASQAVADLGDFALIAGERFAAEGSKMAGVATKLGTVLGAAGLAGAFAGIAVQIGQVAIPKIKEWIGGTEEAVRSQEELEKAIDGVADALRDQRFEEAVASFIDGNEELIDSAAEFGVTTEELARYIFGLERSLGANENAIARNEEGFRTFAAEAQRTQRAIAGNVTELDENAAVADRVGAAIANSADQRLRDNQAALDEASSVRSAAEAADENRRALEELARAQDEAVSGRQSLIGANDRAISAQVALNEAVAATNTAFSESGASSEAAGLSIINLASAFDSQAQAAVSLAEAQAQASGQTFTAADSAQVYASNLFALVGTLEGPARAALLEYIDALDGVPDNLETQLSADVSIAVDDIAGVTSGDYDALVEADADTGPAESAIEDTAGATYEATVDTDADTTLAESDIAEVVDDTYEVTVDVDADVAQARNDLDLLVQPRTATVEVRLTGLAAARAQLASLASQANAINVRGRELQRAIAEWDRRNGG